MASIGDTFVNYDTICDEFDFPKTSCVWLNFNEENT